MRSSSSQTAVALSRVCARFPDATRKNPLVLKDISLSVPAGAFVSITGPSGAGKSTLMRIILGLMKPESGTVVRGVSRSAMVFQNYALFPWLTAEENTAFGLRMRSVPREESLKIAREKLAEVGLAGFARHYPAALSGGQRQRVGLARALAVTPELLVLDEPFSNLDTITAEELKADLLKIWRTYGMTIIMVNHLIPDAIELSDEIVVMRARPGTIAAHFSVDLPRPRDARGTAFFKEVDRLTALLRSVS